MSQKTSIGTDNLQRVNTMVALSVERRAHLHKKVTEAGSKENYLKAVKEKKITKKKKKDEDSKALALAKLDVLNSEKNHAERPEGPQAEANLRDIEAQREDIRQLESEIAQDDDTIMEYDQEVNDLNDMEWETDAPDDPVAPIEDIGTTSGAAGTSPSDPVTIDDDGNDPEDLIVLDSFEDERSGIKPTTVAWGHRGRGEVIINAYGPTNARIHRLEPGSEIFDRVNVLNFSAPKNRHGEAKPDGYYIRHGHEVKTIQGVAFRGMDKLESINPASHGAGRARYPETQVYVKWNINGETLKSWETRSTIRRLWKNKNKADKAIYAAATRAEQRYEEWRNGQREANEGSPTPAPPNPPPQSSEPPEVKQEDPKNNVPPVAASEVSTASSNATPSTNPIPDGMPTRAEFFQSLADVRYHISLEDLMKDTRKILVLTAEYNKAVAELNQGTGAE